VFELGVLHFEAFGFGHVDVAVVVVVVGLAHDVEAEGALGGEQLEVVPHVEFEGGAEGAGGQDFGAAVLDFDDGDAGGVDAGGVVVEGVHHAEHDSEVALLDDFEVEGDVEVVELLGAHDDLGNEFLDLALDLLVGTLLLGLQSEGGPVEVALQLGDHPPGVEHLGERVLHDELQVDGLGLDELELLEAVEAQQRVQVEALHALVPVLAALRLVEDVRHLVEQLLDDLRELRDAVDLPGRRQLRRDQVVDLLDLHVQQLLEVHHELHHLLQLLLLLHVHRGHESHGLALGHRSVPAVPALHHVLRGLHRDVVPLRERLQERRPQFLRQFLRQSLAQTLAHFLALKSFLRSI